MKVKKKHKNWNSPSETLVGGEEACPSSLKGSEYPDSNNWFRLSCTTSVQFTVLKEFVAWLWNSGTKLGFSEAAWEIAWGDKEVVLTVWDGETDRATGLWDFLDAVGLGLIFKGRFLRFNGAAAVPFGLCLGMTLVLSTKGVLLIIVDVEDLIIVFFASDSVGGTGRSSKSGIAEFCNANAKQI